VFVPRPETEQLVTLGLAALTASAASRARQPGRDPGAPLVVELCAGSGAIALSVAHEWPTATVHAVERDEAALTWLRRNARSRAAAGDPPVRVVPGDAADPAVLSDLDARVDLLLCNPPYLPTDTPLEPEVGAHDPAVALFGGPDGLSVIRRILPRAAALLRPGGVLLLEHDDAGHPVAVPDLLAAHGGFEQIVGYPDLTGRPRFTGARRAGTR